MILYNLEAVLAEYERGVRFRCGCGRAGVPESVVTRIRCGEVSPAQLMVCSIHGQAMVSEPAGKAVR
jgi:hypothetical protein